MLRSNPHQNLAGAYTCRTPPLAKLMSRSNISREMRRALQGALSMVQDRGYKVLHHNLLFKPPPTNINAFFRSFPAHFDVTSPVYGENIRFEFWNVPLNKLPGQVGEQVTGRIRRAASGMAVPITSLRLVLVVPQYSQLRETLERRAVERLGAKLEVLPYHFLLHVHHFRRQPPNQLLKDRLMLERFQELYGPVANLPKLSADDLLCRYLGAGPGDVLLSGDGSSGMVSWRLVVPCRRPHYDHPEPLARRVLQERSDKARFQGYLQTISEDPSYY